jgi:predicted amidohydrolase
MIPGKVPDIVLSRTGSQRLGSRPYRHTDTDAVPVIGVNERDGGTLYNTQLLFDADGTLIQRRRKISATYHERLIWGQGDGSRLRAVAKRSRSKDQSTTL